MNKCSILKENDSRKASTLIELCKFASFAKSNKDAADLISNGGIYLNDIRETKNREISTDDLLHGKYIFLRKGKRNYFCFVIDFCQNPAVT